MARKRAPNGNGLSPRLRPDGRWEGRVCIGVNPSTGKKIMRSIYGKTSDEVAEKLRKATHEVDTGEYFEASKDTFAQWLHVWLNSYLPDVKPGTLRMYRSIVNTYLIPGLGGMKLAQLTPNVIQTFISGLGKPQKGQTPIKPKTIKNIHGVLHKSLDDAVKDNLIKINTSSNTRLPVVGESEIKPLHSDEIRAFLEAINGNPYENVFKIALWTGMRLSEILGLQWKRIDFETGRIKVDRQLVTKCKETEGMIFETPKNSKARTMIVATVVLDMLREVKRQQAKWKLAAGSAWDNEYDLVFTNEAGERLSQTTVQHNIKRIFKNIGMSDRHFHELRHTYATEGIRNGIPIKTISENLGHYSVAFTMDVYGHVTDEMGREAADRMDAIFRAQLQGTKTGSLG